MENIFVEEKRYLRSRSVSYEADKYSREALKNLTINICGEVEDNILNLMSCGVLESWDDATTETALLFLDDNAYIERGMLKDQTSFEPNSYYHAWICFQYGYIEYVFDPSFDIFCPKKIYYKTFDIDIQARIFAKEVREFFESVFKESLELQKQKQEIQIFGNQDIYSPIYRNHVGYIADINKGKIKKLVARYYIGF